MPLRLVGRAPDLSPENLAAEARACPVLAGARKLAEWVGEGREVTTRGVLKPAAAVEACDLLGIEPPSRKPRSALDIDELMLVWAAACAAGFIEVFRSRVCRGPSLQPWLEGPPDVVLGLWGACALASMGLVDETGDEGLEYLAVLTALNERGGMVPLRDLDAAIDELDDVIATDCSCPECASGAYYPEELDAADVLRHLEDFGIAVNHGEVAELLPLGHWLSDLTSRANVPPAPVPLLGGGQPAGTGYQIKVQLCGVTKPSVWRRLEVPADIPLDQLHDVIQTAMGWDNSHLHLFSDGSRQYGRPDYEVGDMDERAVRLSQVLTAVGAKIRYTYDFGDDWEHDVVLEKILPADAKVTGPVCTAGKGACPPEDCGGVWGYDGLKSTVADPGNENHAATLEWLGVASADDFDPARFSVAEVNRKLGQRVAF